MNEPERIDPEGGDAGVDPEEVDSWLDEEAEEEGEDEAAREQLPSESITDKYAKSQLRVVRETKDFTLDYLQQALQGDSYIINVAPEYQRRQRWSVTKRSLLVESFLMNIPVPPVFLFERDYNAYEVIDGRQRLDTLREFFANNFSLNGLRYWKELNHKRYNQLPAVIQRGLQRRSLAAVVLLAETRRPSEDDFDVRRVLFDRLNTGGEKLNPQELRNALYPGPFNSLLIQIARSDDFTRVWGIPPRTPDEDTAVPERLAKNPLYRTMADCELVLRVFAIRDALLTGGKGSLRTLLDRSMRKHSAESIESMHALRGVYARALHENRETFGVDVFRLPSSGRLSRPLYDALMVAVTLDAELRPSINSEAVRERLKTALGNYSAYDVLVGRGNTMDAIRQRVKLAGEILAG